MGLGYIPKPFKFKLEGSQNMNKKIITTKPVKPLTLEFEDGVKKEVKFCNYTLMLLDEEFEEGSLNIILNALKKPYANGSKLIYAGMKAIDDTVTLEDVKKIVVGMDINTLIEIIQFAYENLYGGQTQEKKSKKEVQKQAQEILKQIIG